MVSAGWIFIAFAIGWVGGAVVACLEYKEERHDLPR